MLERLLNNIQNFLFFWVLGAVIAGLSIVKLFGGYAFSPLICFFAAIVMIYPSLVPLAFNKLKEARKSYKAIITSLFFNFIVFPALAWALGYMFFQTEPILWLGIFLLSLLPGGGMVTTWAQRSNADMPTTVSLIIFNLLAAVVIFPAVFPVALNKAIAIDSVYETENNVCLVDSVSDGRVSCLLGGTSISPLKILVPIFIIVVVPLLLAYFTQKIIIKNKGLEYFEKNKNFFGKLSNLGLLLVLVILMGIKNNNILFSSPELILKALTPLLLFYVVAVLLVLLVHKSFYKNDIGKAFVWGSSLRYITLALGVTTSLIYQNESLSIMAVVVILAYFVQIPLSFLLSKYFLNN